MDKLPRIVAQSSRMYGILLKAYPAAFRRDYGEEMAMLFHDLALDAWKRRGVWGLICIWGRVFFDLVRSVPRLHLDGKWSSRTLQKDASAGYRSFRLHAGSSITGKRWPLWRVGAVVAASLVALLIGVVACALTQAAMLNVCWLLWDSKIRRHDDLFIDILISTIVAIMVDAWVVAKLAGLIERYAYPRESQAEQIADIAS